MIQGIAKFREHFASYTDNYTLIGGAASYLLMDNRGLDARATSDLDIVLTLEALDRRFVETFWQFIADGSYELQQKSTGEKKFYRFLKPKGDEFPAMLELFSRSPDDIDLANDAHLTPIPADEEVSSLSAILLDDNYYRLIQANRVVLDGLSIVNHGCLIPLKAYAWVDFRRKKQNGEEGHSKSIKKHESDILRLSQMIGPDERFEIPDLAVEHLTHFLREVDSRSDKDLRALGLTKSMDDVKSKLAGAFL